MRDFRYLIAVEDAPNENVAIAEAMHRLAMGEHILSEHYDYTGELPIVGEIKLAKAYDERGTAGPDFVVELVAECHRKISVGIVTGGKVVERVEESEPLSALPSE